MPRFWNFIQNEATPDAIELRIDGKIIDDEQAWLYEWFGIKASSPNKFRQELAEHSGKNITVWINSNGGSCAAAAGIYDALKNHNGEKTCKITRAVSAATVIAMACDKILMSPVGVFMVHNPWTGAEGDAGKFRRVANVLDVIKATIMNAYQAKTGKPREKIAQMMDAETWMSAQMAKNEGFVDDVLYADDPAAGIENSFMFSRASMQNESIADIMNFAEQNGEEGAPGQGGGNSKESILAEAKKLLTAAWQSFSSHEKNERVGEEQELSIKNSDDLKKNYPDIANQIAAEAIKNEQDRVSALDAMSDAANPIVQALIADAKNTGKSADDIKAAVEIAKKHAPAAPPKNDAADHFAKVFNDNAASGVNGVAGAAQDGDNDQKEYAVAVNLMVSAMNNTLNGGKK